MYYRVSLFVFVVVILFAEFSSAQFLQPKEVPSSVKASLDSIFPEIKTPIWKKVGFNPHEKNKYEATATYDRQRIWVTLDETGNVYVVEKAVDKELLPSNVNEYVSHQHPSCVINDSRQIFLSDRKLFLVVAQSKQDLPVVNSGQVFYSILFGEDGTLLGEKSNIIGLMTSFVAASFFIPDFGQFKPFKIRDRIATAPGYDYSK